MGAAIGTAGPDDRESAAAEVVRDLAAVEPPLGRVRAGGGSLRPGEGLVLQRCEHISHAAVLTGRPARGPGPATLNQRRMRMVRWPWPRNRWMRSWRAGSIVVTGSNARAGHLGAEANRPVESGPCLFRPFPLSVQEAARITLCDYYQMCQVRVRSLADRGQQAAQREVMITFFSAFAGFSAFGAVIATFLASSNALPRLAASWGGHGHAEARQLPPGPDRDRAEVRAGRRRRVVIWSAAGGSGGQRS